jgi:hypothetical protein
MIFKKMIKKTLNCQQKQAFVNFDFIFTHKQTSYEESL